MPHRQIDSDCRLNLIEDLKIMKLSHKRTNGRGEQPAKRRRKTQAAAFSLSGMFAGARGVESGDKVRDDGVACAALAAPRRAALRRRQRYVRLRRSETR